MPRTNLCKREVPHARLGQLIAGAAFMRHMNTEQLAAAIGKSENTVRARLRAPGELTVSELTRLGRKLEIPIDELRAAIRY